MNIIFFVKNSGDYKNQVNSKFKLIGIRILTASKNNEGHKGQSLQLHLFKSN